MQAVTSILACMRVVFFARTMISADTRIGTTQMDVYQLGRHSIYARSMSVHLCDLPIGLRGLKVRPPRVLWRLGDHLKILMTVWTWRAWDSVELIVLIQTELYPDSTCTPHSPLLNILTSQWRTWFAIQPIIIACCPLSVRLPQCLTWKSTVPGVYVGWWNAWIKLQEACNN